MADSAPSIGELRRAAAVTAERVDAAVAADLKGPTIDHSVLVGGIVLDLAAAVRQHRQAREAPEAADQAKFRRGLIRTAIVLARLERA